MTAMGDPECGVGLLPAANGGQLAGRCVHRAPCVHCAPSAPCVQAS
jgi:hypothetical protein